MSRILPIAICLLFLASCQKDNPTKQAWSPQLICDNAKGCVINKTGDTVYYAWGSNFFDLMLLPNDTACKYVGELWDYESYVIHFDSDHGHYGIEITDCEHYMELD